MSQRRDQRVSTGLLILAGPRLRTGDDRDTGNVLYRFFPVEIGTPFMAEAFTVDASGEGESDPGVYRKIMEGNIPGRQ